MDPSQILPFFYDDSPLDASTFLVKLPVIESRDHLFQELDAKLHFPDYFGFNWDALFDCLSDLQWIKQNVVAICHADVPLHAFPDDARVYLKILVDAAFRQESRSNKQIIALFPQDTKGIIPQILI